MFWCLPVHVCRGGVTCLYLPVHVCPGVSVICYLPVQVWPGVLSGVYLCMFARGRCNMCVSTCAGLPGVSVTCLYSPVHVCPGVPVNPVLHLQSVRELASPPVSLLIGQLEHSDDPDLKVFLGQAENTHIIIIIIIIIITVVSIIAIVIIIFIGLITIITIVIIVVVSTIGLLKRSFLRTFNLKFLFEKFFFSLKSQIFLFEKFFFSLKV